MRLGVKGYRFGKLLVSQIYISQHVASEEENRTILSSLSSSFLSYSSYNGNNNSSLQRGSRSLLSVPLLCLPSHNRWTRELNAGCGLVQPKSLGLMGP